MPLLVQHPTVKAVLLFLRQEFSSLLCFMTHPFLAHLSYSLKLSLQRIKKAFFIIFPLPIHTDSTLNRRNDVGSPTGTGSEFLFCTELHWPLVDAGHN